eukprot:scaffold32685_cov43-Prasinocladus_malaysianus.AAC.1
MPLRPWSGLLCLSAKVEVNLADSVREGGRCSRPSPPGPPRPACPRCCGPAHLVRGVRRVKPVRVRESRSRGLVRVVATRTRTTLAGGTLSTVLVSTSYGTVRVPVRCTSPRVLVER